MIKISKHTKQLMIIIIFLIFAASFQTYYINMSSLALMEKTDIIISRLEEGDQGGAKENVQQMMDMWDKSSKNWQSIYDHDLVGEVYTALYMTYSSIKEQRYDLAYTYSLQLKYALWDIYSLDKLAFENVF